MDDVLGGKFAALAVLQPLLRGLVAADVEIPRVRRNRRKILVGVDENLLVRKRHLLDRSVARSLELRVRIGERIRHRLVLEKMHLDELLADRGDPAELRGGFRIGDAREVDLEELPVFLAVARRVQHTVDVMEDVFRRQRNFFTIPIDDEKRIC